jgi:hypothetical protein
VGHYFLINPRNCNESTNISVCFKVSNIDKTMALWEKKFYLFFSKFVPGINCTARYNCIVTIQLNSRPLRPGSFVFLPVVSFQISLQILWTLYYYFSFIYSKHNYNLNKSLSLGRKVTVWSTEATLSATWFT